MSKPWAEMMPRERDAVVAEAMGWRDFWSGKDAFRSYLMAYPPQETGIEAERAPVPTFTTDHNDAASIRAEVERRGLQGQFAGVLQKLMPHATIFDLINATPEQQALAFVRACGVEVE